MSASYADWIGRTEEIEELIALAPVEAAAATLDDTTTEFVPGSQLPPLWHWFFFLPRAPQSRLGVDGHPQRGGFMPPIELPRRMFAGARMRFLKPLLIGQPSSRQSLIRDVSQKEGKTGKLAFVTVAHRISQGGEICIEEEQDIVYREPGASVAAPEPCELPPVPANSWTRIVTPDPTLLFRFSALTFNAHRIHYDRTYATTMEGYPGLVVHGPLTAILLMELVRFHANCAVTAFTFRGQAPLFDLAPFRLIATPLGQRVQLEAQAPDGKTTMTASADLAPTVAPGTSF
ncbi:MAG: MaoC family dehydratase N-terminal domain-containing protein [Isosphaeraceae bacterium]